MPAPIILEFDGVKDSIRGWSRRIEVSDSTIRSRLKKGWDAQRTFTTPVFNTYRGQPIVRPPEDLFKRPTDDEAWLLGLIWSDGWIDSNLIGITSYEPSFLGIAADVMGVPRSKIHNNDLYVSCPVVSSRLRKMGLYENKSLTVRWPKGLPANKIWHFVRGVLDGDGCVSLTRPRTNQQAADLRVEIVSGSPWFIASLANIAKKAGLRICVRKEIKNLKSPLYRFQVFHHDSLKSLYRLLYPTNTVPCMQRKRANWQRWLTTPRNPSGLSVPYYKTRDIRHLWAEGMSRREIVRQVSVSGWFVTQVLEGKR